MSATVLAERGGVFWVAIMHLLVETEAGNSPTGEFGPCAATSRFMSRNPGNPDRTVHAQAPDGSQIVRYDRAGKWYLEHPPATATKRTALTLARAVTVAVEAHEKGGTVFPRLPGGGRFDEKYLEASEAAARWRLGER